MGHCYFNNSWYAEKFKVCVVLLSEALQSRARARPMCCLFTGHCRSRQEWGRAIAKAKKRSVLPHRLIYTVRMQNLLYLAAKVGRSHIFNKPHSLSCCQRVFEGMNPLPFLLIFVTSLISWNTQILYSVTESTGLTLYWRTIQLFVQLFLWTTSRRELGHGMSY
jgi:hypothetical protein